jgi:hypothetical protein
VVKDSSEHVRKSVVNFDLSLAGVYLLGRWSGLKVLLSRCYPFNRYRPNFFGREIGFCATIVGRSQQDKLLLHRLLIQTCYVHPPCIDIDGVTGAAAAVVGQP